MGVSVAADMVELEGSKRRERRREGGLGNEEGFEVDVDERERKGMWWKRRRGIRGEGWDLLPSLHPCPRFQDRQIFFLTHLDEHLDLMHFSLVPRVQRRVQKFRRSLLLQVRGELGRGGGEHTALETSIHPSSMRELTLRVGWERGGVGEGR